MYSRSLKKPLVQMLLLTVVQVAPRSLERPSVKQGVALRLTPSAQSWLGEVGSHAFVTSPSLESQTGFWVDQEAPPLAVRSTEKLPLTRANKGSVGCMDAAVSLALLGQEVHCSGPQLIVVAGL